MMLNMQQLQHDQQQQQQASTTTSTSYHHRRSSSTSNVSRSGIMGLTDLESLDSASHHNRASNHNLSSDDDDASFQMGPLVDHSTTAVADSRKNQPVLEELPCAKLAAAVDDIDIVSTVNALRIAVLLVWCLTAILVSTGVYVSMKRTEEETMMIHFDHHATRLLEGVAKHVDQQLEAMSGLAHSLTSYARYSGGNSNQTTFPFVTLPEFSVSARQTRLLGDVSQIQWAPLVQEEQRLDWEAYALETRFQANTAFDQEQELRTEQDRQRVESEDDRLLRQLQEAEYRWLQEEGAEANSTAPLFDRNVLQDGTGYHPELFDSSTGIVRPQDSGPFLPVWQQSPSTKQATLNQDLASDDNDLLSHLLCENPPGVLLTPARLPSSSEVANVWNEKVGLSQYRPRANDYLGDPETTLVFPVYYEEDGGSTTSTASSTMDPTSMVGILSSTLYWRSYLSGRRNDKPGVVATQGILVVIDSSFGDRFSYRIDGPDVTFLSEESTEDLFEDGFVLEDMEHRLEVGSSLHHDDGAKATTRYYSGLELDTEYSTYVLKVYPTLDTKDAFQSSRPIGYTMGAALICLVVVATFLLYDHCVQRRQRTTTSRAISNAKLAACAERELNEYLAHEVRNPLAAAISACSFVSLEVQKVNPLQQWSAETHKSVQEDVNLVMSALNHINELLRTMLELHRASDSQLRIRKQPTRLRKEVLEPVCAMLQKRDYCQLDGTTDRQQIKWILECPESLVLETDCTRLRQVLLNLGRDASKFVKTGFVRIRTEIDHATGSVRISVEDSGPGISKDHRHQQFAKYANSLDFLAQGTGARLCLCKNFVIAMGGEIWLDEFYDSGIADCPGTRFVVDLHTQPITEVLLPRKKSERDLWSEPTANRLAQIDESTRSTTMSCSMRTDTMAPISPRTPLSQQGKPPVIGGQDKPFPSLQEEDHENSSSPAVEEEDHGSSVPEDLSVLFVDDSKVLRKLFCRSIKKARPSWKVHEADCGESALEIVKSEHFDLIFMDQYMASTEKKLLGTETVEELRKSGVSCRICGLSANDLEEEFVHSGADAFVSKPLATKNEELLAVLERVLKEIDED